MSELLSEASNDDAVFLSVGICVSVVGFLCITISILTGILGNAAVVKHQ